MQGREIADLNDLFFLCSLIEYVARKTKNERKVVVNALGRLVWEKAKREGIELLDALMDVYNSWIIRKIDDYNCSMYYENTSYQYASLVEGHAV